jgi:hypothetical protein
MSTLIEKPIEKGFIVPFIASVSESKHNGPH